MGMLVLLPVSVEVGFNFLEAYCKFSVPFQHLKQCVLYRLLSITIFNVLKEKHIVPALIVSILVPKVQTPNNKLSLPQEARDQP